MMLILLQVLSGVGLYVVIGYGAACLRTSWHCRRTLDTLHYETRTRQRRDVKIFFLLLMGLWPISLLVSFGHQGVRAVLELNWKKPTNPFKRLGVVINAHLDHHVDAVLDRTTSTSERIVAPSSKMTRSYDCEMRTDG